MADGKRWHGSTVERFRWTRTGGPWLCVIFACLLLHFLLRDTTLIFSCTALNGQNLKSPVTHSAFCASIWTGSGPLSIQFQYKVFCLCCCCTYMSYFVQEMAKVYCPLCEFQLGGGIAYINEHIATAHEGAERSSVTLLSYFLLYINPFHFFGSVLR